MGDFPLFPGREINVFIFFAFFRFLEGVPAAHLISLGLEVSVVSLNLKISIGESDAIKCYIICYLDYQALGAAQISGLQDVGSGVVRM